MCDTSPGATFLLCVFPAQTGRMTESDLGKNKKFESKKPRPATSLKELNLSETRERLNGALTPLDNDKHTLASLCLTEVWSNEYLSRSALTGN